jgi:oligopeptidase B
LPRIVVRHFDSGAEHAIAFDEEAYAVGISAGYEYDTTTLSFTYSSMTTPAQVFDYDMIKCTRVLRKTQEVPSGHDPSHYVTRRVMAPAKDGETVPVSLLYRKDTKLDGSAPLLLYGYGAYGMSMPAGFSTDALSFVDRGFVYAAARIRAISARRANGRKRSIPSPTSLPQGNFLHAKVSPRLAALSGMAEALAGY